MDAEPLGQLAEGRLRRLATRLGDEPDDVRAARPARRSRVQLVDRGHLAAGRTDRALEVRGLGVEDPVQVAAQRARDLPRLELEERPGRADPPQERARRCRRSSTSRRRGRAGSATRPGSPNPVEPIGEDAARRRPATTNSRCVRPPDRLSEPRARNRPRSQASRQCSGDGGPVEGGDRRRPAGRSPRRPRRRARGARRRRATGASRRERPCVARARRGRRREAERLGPPVAGPRRIDRGELRPQGEDEVAVACRSPARRARDGGDGPVRPSGPPMRGAGRSPPARGSGSRPRRAARDRGAGRRPDRRRRRARGVGAARHAPAARPGGPAPIGARSGARTQAGCWRGPRRRCPAPAWATSAATWSARSIPVVSPTWVATLQTKIRSADAVATASLDLRAGAGSAAGSCRGCPGPRTISSASAIAASASSQAAIPVRRHPRPLDPDRLRDHRLAVDDCVPSWSRAWSVSGIAAAGTTWPRTARTRFARRTPSSKSPPSIWVIAASRMLPTGCPPSGRRPPGVDRSASRRSGARGPRRRASRRRRGPRGSAGCRRPAGSPSCVAQDAGRAAVVGDRDDRGQVARVLLEAAQDRRLAGPAADHDDPRAAGERLPLVDQLDEPAALATG